jgi:hypothetical protein
LMPISAKFLADFTQFESATQSAGAKLRTFQGDAGQASTSIKAMETSAISTTSRLSSMSAQLAGMFTVGAVIAFGREVLSAGDRIQKMADQTSIGTEEIQRLQYIAGQSGTSVESLVGAVQNLQQRLGDDNTGAVSAMKRLGINADAFNKLGTYQQMTTLAEAVRRVVDPTEQASVAAALFGKTWKEILPAIKSGMKDVGDQAPIMSDSTVKSLDRIGDALARAKMQSIGLAGVGVLAIEEFGFAIGDMLSRFNPEHFGVATSELLKLQKQLNDPTGLVGALANAESAAKKFTDNGMAPLPKIIAPTGWALKELNAQLDAELVLMNAATKEAEELAESNVKLTQAFKDFNTTALHRSIDLMRQYHAELVKSTTASGALVLAELEAQTKLNAARGLNAVGAIKLQTTALDTLIAGQEALAKTSQVGISQTAQQQVLMDAYTDALLADAVAQDKAALAAAGVNAEVGKMPPTLRAAAVEANGAAAAFANFGGVVAGVYTALQGHEVSSQFKYAQAGITQLSYSLGGLPPAMHRAGGGPVTGGMSYMVGERGPELFTPTGGGSIRANGAGNIIVPITVQGSVFGSKQELSRAVNEAVTSALRASGVRMPTGA